MGSACIRRSSSRRTRRSRHTTSTPAQSRWQKGLGDDLRLVKQGITGTGSASTVKGGLIVTSTGLLFATAADQKIHVYDSANGTELTTLPLGGPTSGQPSMYEWNGRQYLLVTATADPATGAGAGPTGLVAYTLPAGAVAGSGKE